MKINHSMFTNILIGHHESLLGEFNYIILFPFSNLLRS